MRASGEKRALWGLADLVVIALAMVPVLWIVSLSLKTPVTLNDGTTNPSASDVIAGRLYLLWFDGANFRKLF